MAAKGSSEQLALFSKANISYTRLSQATALPQAASSATLNETNKAPYLNKKSMMNKVSTDTN